MTPNTTRVKAPTAHLKFVVLTDICYRFTVPKGWCPASAIRTQKGPSPTLVSRRIARSGAFPLFTYQSVLDRTFTATA